MIVERPKRVAGDLKRAIRNATHDSGARQAGIDALNKLRRRRAAILGGLGLAGLAAADAAYFGTALGALHVAFLPGALAVDAALAIGGGAIALVGVVQSHREKKRIRNAASLVSLEKRRKITNRKGNRQGIRYGVVEGTWYRTPAQSGKGDGPVHGPSTSVDGIIVRFNTQKAGGLLTSNQVGGHYTFKGAPFGEHLLDSESYNILGTTREAQTLEYIKANGIRLGLKDRLSSRAFVSRWGWNPFSETPPHARAIVGFVEPETSKSGNSYVLRIDGKKAKIYRTGPNFADDPTDFVKDKNGKVKPHSSIRIRSISKNPETIRRLAMRGIVTGKAWWRFGKEGTPVFNRYAGWLRNRAGRLYTPDSIDENNKVRGLAATPGVQETHARRAAAAQAAAEKAAADNAAAAQAAAEKVAAAEKARLKWPPVEKPNDQNTVRFAESLFAAVEGINHEVTYRYGETGSVVAKEPIVRKVGGETIVLSQVEILDGKSSGSSVVRTSRTVDDENHVLEFTIEVLDRKVAGKPEPENEASMMIITYNRTKHDPVAVIDKRNRTASEGQTIESSVDEWARIRQTLQQSQPQQVTVETVS